MKHGGDAMRWPWQRTRSEARTEGPGPTSGEGPPTLVITPEPPPELRAFVEQRMFGHVDGADDWLEAFLTETELDDLATRHVAADLSPAQEARVRQAVEIGTPRQARFNLLMWPQLIPADIRLSALRSAIRQDSDPYMRIAALAGMQGTSVKVPAADWPGVRDDLLSALGDPRAAIRNRATVTLADRLVPNDVSAVLHAATTLELGGSELQNLLGALVKMGADDAATALIPMVLERWTGGPEDRAWLELWRTRGARPSVPAPDYFGMPGLAYIPNLDG